MKTKMLALSGATLLFAGIQNSAKADTGDSEQNSAKHFVHQSKLSQLVRRQQPARCIKTSSVVDAQPEQKDLFGLTDPEPKQIAASKASVAAKQTNERSSSGINPGSSEILRTVMTPVPAGKNSPFRIPAWLAVKRQPAATTTVSSATASPASTTNAHGASPVVPENLKVAEAENLGADETSVLPATAVNPQQAVLLDPDASGKPKIAQNDPASTDSAPKRRGHPAPLDAVFPSTEYIGIAGTLPIGVPDTDPEFPMEKAIYKVLPELKKHRIKIYGWVNPGMDYSTSRNSNIPQSYSVVPRRIELDQAIFRVERVPDTVQQEHTDWGFRATMLYGIDYRWTTSEGWYPATKQLLQHNYLYGFDPVELYGMFYIPKIAGHKIFQGMVMKYGRFISPPDIEAQLAPDNYLWTHSLMFTVDCYTQTGIINTIKLNDQWDIQAGISAGADIAPWDKAAIPTGVFTARWVSKNNNDSIYAALNQINNGRFRGARAVLSQQQMIQSVNGLIQQQAATGGPLGPFQNFDGSTYQFNNLQPPAHDNLQQMNLTWSHRFNKKGTIVTMTEGYFLWQYNALVGGTVNNGPPHTYAGLTGPGAYINGIAPAVGVVNYTAFKVTDKDYFTVRPVDYLLDYKGERTGFPTTYASWTVGWAHRFNSLMMIRPEIRYERALSYHDGTIVKPYDNGNRRFQFTVGLDLIARF
jgi:hypothetical protein